MKTFFIEETLTYDGSQLVSHWAFRRFGHIGDVATAFEGPCLVKGPALVDLEDARAGDFIESQRMLHFLVEHFDTDLERLVLRQRLLAALLGDVLNESLGTYSARRLGDDLYDGEAKLSVSIATVTPISGVIHMGINVISKGTPVPTRGLADYGLAPRRIAEAVMERYVDEIETARKARCKVRAVP